VFGNNGTENRLKGTGGLISHDPEVEEPIDRTHRHAKDVRTLLDGLAFGPKANRQLALLDIQLLGTPKPHAASLRDVPSRAGPLTDQLARKLGHAREHGQDALPARGGRVDPGFGSRPKRGPGRSDRLHRRQPIPCRSGQAIALPDDHRITRSELLQHPESCGPLRSGPRDRLAEQPLAARLRERVELQVHVLILGRHPRRSDLHHRDAPAA
jgi:hypothetical protein